VEVELQCRLLLSAGRGVVQDTNDNNSCNATKNKHTFNDSVRRFNFSGLSHAAAPIEGALCG